MRQELVDRLRLGSLVPRGRLSREGPVAFVGGLRFGRDGPVTFVGSLRLGRLARARPRRARALSATVARTACQVLMAAAVASNAANAAAVTSAMRCLRAYFRSR